MSRSSVRDICIWLVGGSGLAAGLSSACTVHALAPHDWRDRVAATERADLLLVEGSAQFETTWEGNIEALLDHCRRAEVPRLLWITATPPTLEWVKLAPRFDRVFSVDRDDLAGLEAAGGHAPSPLWEATALPADLWPSLDGHRPDAVLWLGGWCPHWPHEWRQRLSSVLQGATEHGLAIAGIEDPEMLPAYLRRYVTESGPTDREAILRRARIVIGADSVRGSPRIAPPVVFDAIACGAAVVTPHGFAYYRAFSISADGEIRHLIPMVRDAASAATEIERLLADDALRHDTVRRCRQIVAYNHTYAHRVATLASAAGIQLLPNPERC